MATNPGSPAPLGGSALLDVSVPMADTPRGGIETGFDGTNAPGKKGGGAQIDPMTGKPAVQGNGSWLDSDAKTVFKTADGLVLRQELLAIRRLAQDVHYTRVKLGYPFSILEKDPNKDTYRSSLPAGTKSLSTQAVPNQAWDLVNKATETVLSDPPQADPSPLNDSEQAHAAASLAERFLTEDSGEDGTNDIALMFDSVDRALVCATSYLEAWTDPVGGGSVPLQILAHPEAPDPANPMFGPDGMPTANPVLRYVSAPEGGQFVTDPADAAPQWQPKIRATRWGREHWRVYPETGPVQTAEKVIGLLYCTISEAKRRWPTVAAMSPDQINQLMGWQPVRFLPLLPPFERARWRMQTGSDTEKSGSSDERLMFYYRVLQKAQPDHPVGADVCISGANGGTFLDQNTLSAEVEVLTADGSGKQREVRKLDIPLVQITPRSDPDDRDPTGRCYLELFTGATEFNATLATAFLEAVNIWLHPDTYVPSTTTVQGYQRAESRATGDAIPITKKDDVPQYGPTPPLPNAFFQGVEWNDQAIRSIASLNKPVTGQDGSEVSGKARQIAVEQAMVGLSRMQHPVNAAYERFCRIKLQLAMRDYQAPQMLRYVGEDGAWQEQQWKGTDFALVGSVGIQAGTGTMMTPDRKLQFLANLKAEGMLPPDEAADAARPTYAQRLGLSDNPHEQYIERCVTAWLDGPEGGKEGPWVTQWRAYQQQLSQFQQAQAAQQQAAQQAMAVGQPAPQMPPMQPPVEPWQPFKPRPNDSEPPIAAMWQRKLSRVISTVKYDLMPPEWQGVLTARYQAAVQVMQAVQAAANPQPQPAPSAQGKPVEPTKPTPGSQPTTRGPSQ